MKQYRQGDVLLIPVESFDSEFVHSNTKTVALGEATGHHHTFDGDVEVLVRPEDSNLAVNEQGMLVEVKKESTLRHQEHAPIVVAPGKYRRVIQREFSHDYIRTVVD